MEGMWNSNVIPRFGSLWGESRITSLNAAPPVKNAIPPSIPMRIARPNAGFGKEKEYLDRKVNKTCETEGTSHSQPAEEIP